MPRGTLEVILISANGLHNNDFLSNIDPYVILTYRTQEQRSSVLKGSGSHPQWNESFLFTISDNVSQLNLKLMDKDTFTNDDFLGQTNIGLDAVFYDGSIPETVYNVVNNNVVNNAVLALTFTPECLRAGSRFPAVTNDRRLEMGHDQVYREDENYG